ncbi:MAG: ABC transporter substrate-binding protein [Anaerolineae bacterium]|nr:ABC transporter substrate-binding protein [Anaerolineae bacterium]
MKQNKTSLWLIGVLLLSLMLAACSSGAVSEGETAVSTPEPTVEVVAEPTAEPEPAGISLTDALGNTIELDAPAQKIVSLAPSNTEVLFAIGAGSQVIGRDSVSDYPAEALAVADIGGGFGELAVETIVSLAPDLVLAADITPPEQVEALTDVGLTVFALPNPTDLPGMYENLRTVALLTGHEAETEALVADYEARVTAVTDIVATAEEKPLVFYEIDGTDANAPWTSGAGTFVDTLITMSGGSNVGAVLDGAWAQISVEELIAQNPDIIILGDFTWGGVTPEDVAARESWGDLTAVQNSAVYTFDDNLVSRPGPRLVEGLENMAALLHPDLFE